MPLVKTEELLLDAKKNGYAVGAFNAENMEMVQAIVSAADDLNAPVIIQTTPSTIKYGGLAYYFSMVKTAAESVRVPVAIHLDHGNSFELVVQALRVGYTSIMIDGSHYVFNENVQLTKKVVEICKPIGIPVEAELGKLGGKEDDLEGGSGGYTVPEEAREFAEQTGVNSLAVAIGTAHGVYHGVPKLDKERLSEIKNLVSIPLILHGASGLSNQEIQDCISRGICKVNFATELRIAFSEGVKKLLSEVPDTFDPKAYGKVGKENVKQIVKNRIIVCGCNNRY
jgi:tagatose 1,6-diphosphate aldolase GatY/KbaY